jgi:hypothetical protein
MTKVRTLLFLILLCSSMSEALSQNFEDALAKASGFYNKDRYEMDIQHLLYSLDGDKLIESQDIVILRDGNKFYTNSYGTEQIRNSDYHVVVNHYSRLVYIASLHAEVSDEEKKQQQEIQSDLQKFISLMKELSPEKQGDEKKNDVQYMGIKGNSHVYHITFRGGTYETADLYFGKRDGKVKKCEYFLRDAVEVSPGVQGKAKLVIVSKKFKEKGRIDKKRFSTDAIFHVGKDKKVVLTDQYKEYTPIVEM